MSLPGLRRPHGNLSRPGGTQMRLQHLQRQFEHAGKSRDPLSLSERSRHLSRVSDDARSPQKTIGTAAAAAGRGGNFGSDMNVLEMRLCEATQRRSKTNRDGGVLGESALDVASRAVAEDCLTALRNIAGALTDEDATSFGHTLQRIADTLEPILFSARTAQLNGQRLTHEQVVRSGEWAISDAGERAARATEDAVRAAEELRQQCSISTTLEAELAATAPHVASLESSKAALELELKGSRRQIGELQREAQDLKESVQRLLEENNRAAEEAMKAAASRQARVEQSTQTPPLYGIDPVADRERLVRSTPAIPPARPSSPTTPEVRKPQVGL